MNISVETAPPPGDPVGPPIDALPYGAMLVSRAGDLLSLNPVARDVLARLYDCRPVIGRPLAGILTDPSSDLAGMIRAAASGGSLALDLIPGGRPLRVEVGAPSRRGGPFLLTIGPPSRTDRAFSALRGQVAELTSAAARERQLRRQIESSHAALEGFATIAAHDLRQPLRNIELLLEFLTEDYGTALPKPALDLVTRARTSAKRLEGLVGRLLEHARAGTDKVEPAPVDLDTMVDEIESEFGPAFADAGATLCRPGPLGTVTAAPVLLRQALENLIGNAVKYAQPGRPPVITVTRLDEGRTLEIADNGRGFAEDEAVRLFDPFVRLHSNDRIEGSGIGLANVRTIVERHGWTIRAEGRPGAGATFRISGLTDPPARPGGSEPEPPGPGRHATAAGPPPAGGSASRSDAGPDPPRGA